MRFIRKLDNFLAAMEKAIIVVLFTTLAFSIVLNVLLRNVFHVSFQSILEFSPALVLWLALMGSSLALKDNRHIKIEILLRFVSDQFASLAHKITAVFGMGVMSILFYASLSFVTNEISIFGFKGVVTFVFPWFFMIAFFRFLLKLMDSNNPAEPLNIGDDII